MKLLLWFIASCISESGMNYLNMCTQLQTPWKCTSPAIRNSVAVFMTILSLWKHLKTELFLSQWSYWINLFVCGKVIILLDISSKLYQVYQVTDLYPNHSLSFEKIRLFSSNAERRDSAIRCLTVFNRCPVLTDPPELAMMEQKWSQTQVRTQNWWGADTRRNAELATGMQTMN